MQDILEILGGNIKRLRKDLGWTQEKLAEKAGISVPFMTQIELGHKSASLEVVAKIADALGVDCGVLFLRTDLNEPNGKAIAYSLNVFEKTIFDDIKALLSKRISELEEQIK